MLLIFVGSVITKGVLYDEIRRLHNSDFYLFPLKGTDKKQQLYIKNTAKKYTKINVPVSVVI